MKKIQKHDYTEHAQYYESYISKVDETKSVLDQLKHNTAFIKDLLKTKTDEQLLYKYAADKWSIKDVVMHIIDCERVFMYRAMRFARQDKTPLPFFDENEFAAAAQADKLPKQKLLKEYLQTRQASIVFLNNLTAKQLKTIGIASNYNMSVRACAWIICGHELHHSNTLREKYLTQ
jgi:uncharacterized damage-inducible protein DinB